MSLTSLSPDDVLRAWAIPTSSRNLGGDAWRTLCYALSLAEDLDDAAEVLDLLRTCRRTSADPARWWESMVEALRPIERENPLLLDLLGLPMVPNPLTLALAVARKMKREPAARAGFPQ